ncbi:hypothetical protein [Synechococcus sp. M16CYN]|uniref:hypothetical protein n=1 Tax=Synechococcus sp. M16CYN TaxID=3103139 RepID=UPI003341F324
MAELVPRQPMGNPAQPSVLPESKQRPFPLPDVEHRAGLTHMGYVAGGRPNLSSIKAIKLK